MQSSKSHIKDSIDFIRKIKDSHYIPNDAILVTVDVVGLYLSIPHDSGLKNILDKRKNENIPTADLIKMTEFALKNNYFEFNGKVKQQISGTGIRTKCTPPYACIYMDEFENEFLSLRSDKPLVWLRYIDDVFFIWTHGEKELHRFMEALNNHQSNIKFTYTFSKNCVPSNYQGASLPLIYIPSLQIDILHFTSSHPNHTKRSIIYSQAL